MKLISELMTAAGLTTVHDALANKDDFVAYQDALAAGEMRFRVYLLAMPELLRRPAARPASAPASAATGCGSAASSCSATARPPSGPCG